MAVAMSDVEQLIALEEIKRLKATRDRAVDQKNRDLYLSLHAPDHVSDHEEFPAWNSAAEMIENVKALLPEGKISVHHSHSPEITFESPTKAKGIWGMEDNIYWQEDGTRYWLRGAGFYYESYEKRDGDWKFIRRRMERTHVRTSIEPASVV